MTRSPLTRAAYGSFVTYPTRWRDNDVYGHLNNAVFYEYVDTAVNGWLVGTGALEVPTGPVIALVAETRCTFFASLAFPRPIDCGLRIERLGRSSVTYGVGLFEAAAQAESAQALFTHVCVDSESRRPVPLPPSLCAALADLPGASGIQPPR